VLCAQKWSLWLEIQKTFVHVFRKEVRVDDPLSRDFEPKYNNFYGFLFSVLPQAMSWFSTPVALPFDGR
jgi:hypothetical protein